MIILTDICGLKQINYYNNCSNCNATDKSKLCYTTEEEVLDHLKGFDTLFIHPQIQKFYLKWGTQYKETI